MEESGLKLRQWLQYFAVEIAFYGQENFYGQQNSAINRGAPHQHLKLFKYLLQVFHSFETFKILFKARRSSISLLAVEDLLQILYFFEELLKISHS